MAAKLIAEEGFLKGLVLSLEEDGSEWIIGRDPEACQLLVEDPAASRKQLICRSTSEGILIENLSTTNPIKVNNEEVKEPRLLHQGDAIKIGSGVFRFYTETAATVDDLNLTINNAPNQHQEVNEKAEEDMEQRYDTIYEEAEEDKASLAEINFDLMDTGRWLLKVVSGPNNGAEFSMQANTSYVIGTDHTSCDIVFHDISVSRQHARITLGDDDTVVIEDLKSRNGTIIEDQPIEGKKTIASNTLVTTGTTTFMVFDREGDRPTIISPLLPSIVKVLQKEEAKKEESLASAALLAQKQKEEESAAAIPAKDEKKEKGSPSHVLGALILIAIISGLFVVVSFGITTLFQTQEIVQPQIDTTKQLVDALNPFPSVKYSFNKITGRLLLVGHVLTPVDRNQILYNLQGLNFIKTTDDTGIIIDEYVWQEINQILNKNPSWRGITVYSPSAGHFVLTGYLQTRKQADQLVDYINQNFAYLDLLEKKVIVEEDVLTQINVLLQEKGFRDILVQIFNGEVKLSGTMPHDKGSDLETLIEQIKGVSGVRAVKNFVAELAPEQSIINITDKYEVTGYSQSKSGISVVINGRILSQGDALDGMTITSIKSNGILLERDGVKYKIDYNK